MKILVTGATGFIGKNLVNNLLEKGHEVVCIVRKTSKVDYLKEKKVSLVVADLLDSDEVEKVFSEIGPEAVFHCAAAVMENNEGKLHNVNVTSTRNICKACYGNNIRRLVYLSSIAVISGNVKVPLTDDLPYKANSSYGRSKIEAEKVVMDFREKGLTAAVIRPCMVYGEDEPHGLDKMLRAVAARRIPVFDVPGMDSKLNLVHVDNVVQVLMLALEKDEALEGAFMVADEEAITLRKFFEICYDELGSSDPPVIPAWIGKILLLIPAVKKRADGYFKDRVYDISRAQDLLGYDPKVGTEDGLRQVIRYWKKNRSDKA
ncbi:MAG: NAD(P)-dependent oxidoreductase [Candidatus Omnitrophota bacterium]